MQDHIREIALNIVFVDLEKNKNKNKNLEKQFLKNANLYYSLIKSNNYELINKMDINLLNKNRTQFDKNLSLFLKRSRSIAIRVFPFDFEFFLLFTMCFFYTFSYRS